MYNLQEVIDMMEIISEEYGKILKESDISPTFEGFSKFLTEEVGINDKFQVVDKSKWTQFILSRS